MDLRLYYQKVREFAETIEEEFPIVVSHETPDGGKSGTLTEVSARLAAKMAIDGTVRMAKPQETETFRQAQAEAKRLADQEAAVAKVQLTVLSMDDLNRLKGITQ